MLQYCVPSRAISGIGQVAKVATIFSAVFFPLARSGWA